MYRPIEGNPRESWNPDSTLWIPDSRNSISWIPDCTDQNYLDSGFWIYMGRYVVRSDVSVAFDEICVVVVLNKTRRLGAFPWDALVYELLPKVRMSDKLSSHSKLV